MAMATCWNCGARLTGPKCQWCGAAQTPDAPQGPSPSAANTPQAPASYYGPGASAGQPADWQNQRTIVNQPQGWQSSPTIPGQPGGWQSAQPPGYQQPQPGQSGNWQVQPTRVSQMSDWQAQQATPGQMSGWQGAQPPPGYQQPAPGQAFPGMQPAVSAAGPTGVSDSISLLLGSVGGLVGGTIGAIIWAFIIDLTKINFTYFAFGLGIIVGLGVALGARGHHDIGLSLFAGVLGLFSFFLALYFRLSLRESHMLGESANLFALSLNDFSNILGDYLATNPINFLNFVLVPIAAMGTAYRYIHRG